MALRQYDDLPMDAPRPRPYTPASSKIEEKTVRTNKYPAEGITLEMKVNALVENYGWERLGEKIFIRCFTHNPTVKSSLTFLRKTPWARTKVEQLYDWRAATNWDPRDNEK